jgi:hypothetical protein
MDDEVMYEVKYGIGEDSCQWRTAYIFQGGKDGEAKLREEFEQAGAEFLYTSHTEDDEGAVDEMHVMWRSIKAYNRYNEYKAMKHILRKGPPHIVSGLYQIAVPLPPSVTKALTLVVEAYGRGEEVTITPVERKE